MHDHTSCYHELKFCQHCNTVYCPKCKQEWKQGLQFSYGSGGYPGNGGTLNPFKQNDNIVYCSASEKGESTLSNTHKHN